jgi:DNA-binding SARP family transcriptional activator/tetratricopeptide (TPR) repeat protein
MLVDGGDLVAARLETPTIEVRLLGTFQVTVGAREVSSEDWPGRRAGELVQLLALAPRHRLVRDQVIEALWPHLDVVAAGANLRKAAHYARRALGDPGAVVLRRGEVVLLPSGRVKTDVSRFEAEARAALAGDDAARCAAAGGAYAGDLLPGSRYEEWTQAARERLREQYLELLRRAGAWEQLVEAEPTDERAYQQLMRSAIGAGSRHAAIHWYGRLRTALARELGMLPGPETEAIYEHCIAGLGLTEPAFVGRQAELARATVVLRSGPGAEIGVVVVRGPAGIGKSALCRQIADLARAQGSTVITVGGHADSPYAPLARAVEQLVVGHRSALDGVRGRARSVMAELLALRTPAKSLEGSVTRHQVIGAIRRLLLALPSPASVVLIVDDAHIADETTIDVLLQLAAGGTPLLVLLSYRPDAAAAILREGVARLTRAGRAIELDLGPLDRQDAAALVTAAAPGTPEPAAIERILELGDGNPFFTLELARTAGAGPPVAIPSTLAEAVNSRFVDLNEGAAAMLERLALVGDDLTATSVMALTGLSEAEAFALLDAAIHAGVLVVSGARYKFRHELVRQALAARVAPHQRIAVHRDAARRFAEAGAPPGLIARHWLDGERPTDARDWLIAAARNAIRLGAFADAVIHLEAVLRYDPDHGEALRLRGEALDALGDIGAPAAYAAAVRVARDPETDELRAKQALAQLKAGDPPGALQTLAGVEPTTVDGRLAQALTLAAAAALGFSDPQLGAAKAAESRRLALQSGDPASVLIASWARAAAAHARGQLRHSLAVDLSETSELPDLALSVFDGQLCITQRLLYGAAPYPDVIAWADALAAEAKRLHAARGHAFAITLRGEAKLLSGQLDAADDDLAEGARLHRAIGAATGESLSLERRAEVALYRGRATEAAALLDDALAVARESDAGFHLFDRIYGARIIAAPDPQAALAEVEEAEAAVRGPVETCPGCRITLAVPAAIAAARARDMDRTTHWAKESQMLATVVNAAAGLGRGAGGGQSTPGRRRRRPHRSNVALPRCRRPLRRGRPAPR